MSTKPLLHLYRHILKSAKVFPSKNRERILREIKSDFRKNRDLTDAQKVGTAVSMAEKGLAQLNMYSHLPKERGDWEVHLEKQPMPKRTVVDLNDGSAKEKVI